MYKLLPISIPKQLALCHIDIMTFFPNSHDTKVNFMHTKASSTLPCHRMKFVPQSHISYYPPIINLACYDKLSIATLINSITAKGLNFEVMSQLYIKQIHYHPKAI